MRDYLAEVSPHGGGRSSLRAGVQIASVAREMGHTTTEQTYKVYGGWCREMGADAAAMRKAWASRADERRQAAD